MATQRREYSAVDAQQIVLYAKRDADANIAFPVIASSFGTLVMTLGLAIPLHDQQVIDESDPNNVTITYKLNSVTVAVKSIVISGSTTTITVT